MSPHAHSCVQGQASPEGASQEPAQRPSAQGCPTTLRAKSVQNSSATPEEAGYDGGEIPLGEAPSPACSSLGRGWCPAARTDLPAPAAPVPAAGKQRCLYGVGPEDMGTRQPRGLAGASSSTTQGLLALGQGSFPRDRAWPRNRLARGVEWCCKPHPGSPHLALPAEILVSRRPHSFEGVYGFSVSPLSRAKIAPFKGATGPRVAGALPAAGCSFAAYRLIYWKSSLALPCFSLDSTIF